MKRRTNQRLVVFFIIFISINQSNQASQDAVMASNISKKIDNKTSINNTKLYYQKDNKKNSDNHIPRIFTSKDFSDVFEKNFILEGYFLLIGLSFCFLGSNFKTFQFINGYITALFFLSVTIIYGAILIERELASWVFWPIYAFSITIGVLLGILMRKYSRVFYLTLSSFIGFVLTEFLFVSFIYRFTQYNYLIYWSVVSGTMVLFFILGFFLRKPFKIISRSITGSFLVIKGVSCFLWGLPSATNLLRLSNKNDNQAIDQLISWRIYAYIGGFVLMSIFSLTFLYILKKDHQNKQKLLRYSVKSVKTTPAII